MPPLFGVDPRFLFLALLLTTGILYTLRFGRVLGSNEIKNLIISFLLVPSALGLVTVFFALLFRVDLSPYIRDIAIFVGGNELVSFQRAIPAQSPDLTNNLEVTRILREDTDGDGFEEWVVFYKFELQNGTSPIKAAVYDSDRGNPPVIFPYRLQPPDRDYLIESPVGLDFDLLAVTNDSNGPDNGDLPELMISDANHLALFRFQQNSEPWDFPRDAPPRYVPIGYFTGTGGVEFNSSTRQVTVIDRDQLDRSQLVVRSIYGLQQDANNGESYWSGSLPLVESTQVNLELAPPLVSTIDFFEGPPRDLLNSLYPEKIVLGFYASVCRVADQTLCINADDESDPAAFLAGEALGNFQGNQAGYFGLLNFNVTGLSVTSLRYFPALESDPDLLVTGQGRDVVTGEHPRLNVVEVTFTVDGQQQTRLFQLNVIEGQWKIVRRLEANSADLGSAIEIPAQ
ncbi:MAG TPA: hypothetical protein PKD98_06920 [Anaerolineae bacterium]|nr:hypothetical protein [Anaerolineae bacterium]